MNENASRANAIAFCGRNWLPFVSVLVSEPTKLANGCRYRWAEQRISLDYCLRGRTVLIAQLLSRNVVSNRELKATVPIQDKSVRGLLRQYGDVLVEVGCGHGEDRLSSM